MLEKKAEANDCFTRKEYERAVELYTQLIKECSSVPSLRTELSKIYHNRAVTFEKIVSCLLYNDRPSCIARQRAIRSDPSV